MCAVHAERGAGAGTCERCGNFMCEECRAPDAGRPMCVPCFERTTDSRMVAHVRVFAVVLVVHGVLVGLAGLFAAVYGTSLFASFWSMPAPDPAEADRVRGFENLVVALMLAEALLHLSVGVLQAVAGLRLRSYRSRGLGIGALLAGLATVLGCYCSPSATVLLVWGLVVLSNGAVAERFAAVRRSAT